MFSPRRIAPPSKPKNLAYNDLVYFLLYNPTVTNKEDRADENILYFFSNENTTFDLNDQMNTAGLVMSMSNLLEKFDTKPIRGFSTQNTRTAYCIREKDYYFILTTSRDLDIAPSDSSVSTYNRAARARDWEYLGIEHMELVLSDMYDQFVLHFGSLAALANTCGMDSFRKRIGIYLSHVCQFVLVPSCKNFSPLMGSIPFLEYAETIDAQNPFTVFFILLNSLYLGMRDWMTCSVVLLKDQVLYSDVPRVEDLRQIKHWVAGWGTTPWIMTDDLRLSATQYNELQQTYPILSRVSGRLNSKTDEEVKKKATGDQKPVPQTPSLGKTEKSGGSGNGERVGCKDTALGTWTLFGSLVPTTLNVRLWRQWLDEDDNGGVVHDREGPDSDAFLLPIFIHTCPRADTIAPCTCTGEHARPTRHNALIFEYKAAVVVLILNAHRENHEDIYKESSLTGAFQQGLVTTIRRELTNFFEAYYESNIAPYIQASSSQSSQRAEGHSDPRPQCDVSNLKISPEKGEIQVGTHEVRASDSVTSGAVKSNMSPRCTSDTDTSHVDRIAYVKPLIKSRSAMKMLDTISSDVPFLHLYYNQENFVQKRNISIGMVRMSPNAIIPFMYHLEVAREFLATHGQRQVTGYKDEIRWKLNDQLWVVARRLDQRIFIALILVTPQSTALVNHSPRGSRLAGSLLSATANIALHHFDEASQKCCNGIPIH